MKSHSDMGGGKGGLPVARYTGILSVGNSEIGCAVLEDGTRLLTQSDMMRALGRARQAKGRSFYDADVNLPAFLTAKNLKDFIPSDLYVTSSQIQFLMPSGQKAFGYNAELLPLVCEVYLEARDANALVPSQQHVAKQAELLVRSLAKIGIVALVDESTGYQRDRGHNALRLLLERYIAEGLQKWIHTFPDSFFAEIDRLYDNAPTTPRSRPQYYGRWIKHAASLGLEYMALLLPSDWAWAADRSEILAAWPLARIYALPKRSDFKEKGRPTNYCAWHIFDRAHMGEVIFRRAVG